MFGYKLSNFVSFKSFSLLKKVIMLKENKSLLLLFVGLDFSLAFKQH